MRFVISAVILIVAAQALPARADDTQKSPYGTLNTVGIISAVGHNIHLTYTGTTVFSNSADTLVGDDLGIDDRIAADIAKMLPPSIAVKPVTFDKDAFSTQATSWLALSQVPVKDLVGKMPDQGVDAYIVVVPFPVQDPLFLTNQYIRGLGLYRRGILGTYSLAIYALYLVEVVDSRTGKIVSDAVGSLGKSEFLDRKLPLMERADPSLWADHAADLTAEQKKEIASNLVTLLDQSIPWAVAKLGIAAAPAEAVTAPPTRPAQ